MCDTTTYPYASCNDPQIKGSSCTDDSGTRYATCTCPSANNGQWGCKEYYAAPCNSICKTPYTDSCHLHESVSTPYGCEKYFEGCSSKCEVAYKDNCRNHDAVISSCPDNASCSYFSDCSSKIQSWSCNSGYEKSGNSCVQAIKSRACQYVGDILYNDGSCALGFDDLDSKLIPVGIVFDIENHLAVALHDIDGNGQISKNTYLTWSTCINKSFFGTRCDTSSTLKDCRSDGNANTQSLVNGSSASCSTPAAIATRNYSPKNCASFCTKGKWFLPSARDLLLVYENLHTINEMLNYLSFYNATEIQTGNAYWSSTEFNAINAWYIYPEKGWETGYPQNAKFKNQSASVRPVIKF